MLDHRSPFALLGEQSRADQGNRAKRQTEHDAVEICTGLERDLGLCRGRPMGGQFEVRAFAIVIDRHVGEQIPLRFGGPARQPFHRHEWVVLAVWHGRLAFEHDLVDPAPIVRWAQVGDSVKELELDPTSPEDFVVGSKDGVSHPGLHAVGKRASVAEEHPKRPCAAPGPQQTRDDSPDHRGRRTRGRRCPARHRPARCCAAPRGMTTSRERS